MCTRLGSAKARAHKENEKTNPWGYNPYPKLSHPDRNDFKTSR